MTLYNRGIMLAGAFFIVAAAAPAVAQENLDSGKSAAQLYASDCAICHKSPQSVAKGGGLFGLSSFLREHYTASRESAAVIATYLESLGKPAATPRRSRASKRTAKEEEKAKVEGRRAMEKSGEIESGDMKRHRSAKPLDKERSEPKTGEAKGSEPSIHAPKSGEAKRKAGDDKASSSKKIEAKSQTKSHDKSRGSKSTEAKGHDSKSDAGAAAKPDKPAKSD